MFKKLFGSKPAEPPEFDIFITARLNARVQPLDRGDVYEDPLDDVLQKENLGEVTGGGTMMAEDGGIAFCDLEIAVKDSSTATCNRIIAILEELGAPKGSSIIFDEDDAEEIPFGRAEGLAVYINGTDLDAEVYKTSDVNHVISEFDRLLDGAGKFHSHWESNTETALYLYGDSAETMKERIAGFMAEYPLCEKARIEQIA